MIKNPVTIPLTADDIARRQKWRDYQLLCAQLLERYTAAELIAMRRRLAAEEGANRTDVLRVAIIGEKTDE